MSDALTDISRDERRVMVIGKIDEIESKGELTRTDIEELIKLWTEYKGIRRGYWTSSNQELADKKIKEYQEQLAGTRVYTPMIRDDITLADRLRGEASGA